MVIVTKRLRKINGSFYFLIDKELVRELNIDDTSLIQVEIRVVKKTQELPSPVQIEDINLLEKCKYKKLEE